MVRYHISRKPIITTPSTLIVLPPLNLSPPSGGGDGLIQYGVQSIMMIFSMGVVVVVVCRVQYILYYCHNVVGGV